MKGWNNIRTDIYFSDSFYWGRFFILTLCREYFGATIIDYGWLFFAIGSFLDASNVADIFDVLHVTVYDEDRGGKTDFLGAIVIPLLEVSKFDSNYLTNTTARKVT